MSTKQRLFQRHPVIGQMTSGFSWSLVNVYQSRTSKDIILPELFLKKNNRRMN